MQQGVKASSVKASSEATFYANSDQFCFWGDDSTKLMCYEITWSCHYGFRILHEVNGFVSDGVRVYSLKHMQKDDGPPSKTSTSHHRHFERVDPTAQGLLLFDNTPSHENIADDALNVGSMNVHPGRVQSAMRSTTWEGQTLTQTARQKE